MANKARGTVDFEAGGQIYTLKMSTNAICQIEDLSGEGINEFTQGLNDPELFKVSNLRIILFACLKGGKSVVDDLDHAGDILDDIGLEKATEIIRQTFEIAFPAAKDSKDKDLAGKPKAAR